MADYNIPFSMASANIEAATPSRVNANIPMQAEPFKGIDTVKSEMNALKLADTQEEFKSDQEKRLLEHTKREDQLRDKQQIEMVQKAGLNLSNPDDIEKAIPLLKGKISDTAMEGLQTRLDQRRTSAAKLEEMISKSDEEAVKQGIARQEETLRMLEGPLTAYEDAKEKQGEGAAKQAFEASKKATLDMLSKEVNPVNGKPRYNPQQLAQLAQLGPEQLKNLFDHSKYGLGILEKQYKMRKEKALTEKYEADAVWSKSRPDIERRKNELTEEKIAKLVAAKSFDENDARAAAEMIAAYKMKPLSGYAMRSPYGQKVMSLVKEINADYDEKQFDVQKGNEKAFTFGKKGDTVRSFNALVSHLGTLEKAGEALENGDVKTFNQMGNAIAAWSGSAPPKNFDAVKELVGAEIVKAITATGGGVTDREEAKKTIDAANSPSQFAGVLKQYKELVGGQLNAMRKQYESGGGKDFDKFLLEDSKDAFHVAKDEQKNRDSDAVKILRDELEAEQKKLKSVTDKDDKHRVEQNIESIKREIKGKGGKVDEGKPAEQPAKKKPPLTNAKGWKLMTDKNGNMAYVGPNKEIEEVKEQ